MQNNEKTIEELRNEVDELKEKYSALETKYNKEVENNKIKEEALLMKLMFLEGVANSAFDGFLVVDPRGQKILQNQRTIDLWKIPKHIVEDAAGIKQVEHVMYMTVNPKQFVDEINYLRDHPNDISKDELELIDGTILERYSSPVIGPDGINYGRIWTFHDITERKNMEKKLIQLNADKDKFISILAHDLKTPFNSLLGFSDLLVLNIRKYPLDKIEKQINTIHEVAQQTYDLLEDILLWVRIQADRLPFEPATISLYSISEEVIKTLKLHLNAKKISTKSNIDKNIQITADIFMLKTVMRNLISNAFKFTNQGGNIEIAAIQDTTGTTINITDNGIGIEPTVLQQLFNYTTIRSTRGTENESGSGFGLLLCKEFIEKHGGKIWIDSTVNVGTTVNLFFPNKMKE